MKGGLGRDNFRSVSFSVRTWPASGPAMSAVPPKAKSALAGWWCRPAVDSSCSQLRIMRYQFSGQASAPWRRAFRSSAVRFRTLWSDRAAGGSEREAGGRL